MLAARRLAASIALGVAEDTTRSGLALLVLRRPAERVKRNQILSLVTIQRIQIERAECRITLFQVHESRTEVIDSARLRGEVCEGKHGPHRRAALHIDADVVFSGIDVRCKEGVL